MPLLGIFGRKSKSSRTEKDGPPASIYSQTTSEVDSVLSSPVEYGTPDRPLPSFPNGMSNLHPHEPLNIPGSSKPPAQPSKLRLFGRKKPSATPSAARPSVNLYDTVESVPIPQPPYYGRTSTGTASDGGYDAPIRPPPSKTALFSTYGDPHSALSTRSLPNDTSHALERITTPGAEQPKKSSFFHWRSSPASSVKSNPAPKNPAHLATEPPSPPPNSSFNLKSFRHVRPPSPTQSDIGGNASTASLSAPIPRPRGLSTNSDASQRISVAAFREAQARRSTAGSPVPSFRAPSPNTQAVPMPILDNPRGRSNPPHQHSPLLPHNNSAAPGPSQHRRSIARSIDSESEESEEESEESEDDSKGSHAKGNGPPPTRDVKKGRAQSELGHGLPHHSSTRRPNFTPGPRSQSAYVMGPTAGNNAPPPAPRTQPTVYEGNVRSRASASTSALTPNAAARRASILAKANAGTSRHKRDLSTQSNPSPAAPVRQTYSDSEDSEDDAPLAALVGPRKPDSAASSATQLPGVRKPLIDINDLIGKPARRSETTDDGFTGGSTLLSGRLTSSPTPITPPAPSIVARSPPIKFISPPSSPRAHSRELSSSTITPTPHTTPILDAPKTQSPALSSSTASTPPQLEHRRDILSERLTRAVQRQVGASPAASTVSSGSKDTPLSSPVSEHAPTHKPSLQSLPKSHTIPIPRATAPAHQPSNSTPPAEDLADVLGAGVKLISRTGDSSTESESSESSESESEEEQKSDSQRIAPIPIKERTPPPAFSVTSRPQRPRGATLADSNRIAVTSSTTSTVTSTSTSTSTTTSIATKSSSSSSKGQSPMLAAPPTTRKRSSTVVPSSNSSSFGVPPRPAEVSKPISPPSSNAASLGSAMNRERPTARQPVSSAALPGSRQRSSTMAPLMTASTASMFPPAKPFAARGDSPASSTGGSSSGRAPLTPRDGSDIASASGSSRLRADDSKPKQQEWSGGASGLGLNKHVKRRSVSFEDEPQGDAPGDEEAKRRERRRSEAKAAIELGNVINGRGPIMDDDDDDLPINQTMPRMAPVNPMMGMGMGMNMGMGMPMMNFAGPGAGGAPGWGPMGPMLSPAQFIPPTPTDPALLAAHQQAMMYAKQAYQMAVAQQAMAAAADEWERGSAISGFGGGGGGSVYGGSAYGGYGNGWSTGSAIFPNTNSMYGGGFSSSRSEYGGGGGRGQSGWSSARSTYGESFGPDRHAGGGNRSSRYSGRDSTLFPPVPAVPQQGDNQRRDGNSSRNSAALLQVPGTRSRTTSQPASSNRGNLRKAPPPSSWKPTAR